MSWMWRPLWSPIVQKWLVLLLNGRCPFHLPFQGEARCCSGKAEAQIRCANGAPSDAHGLYERFLKYYFSWIMSHQKRGWEWVGILSQKDIQSAITDHSIGLIVALSPFIFLRGTAQMVKSKLHDKHRVLITTWAAQNCLCLSSQRAECRWYQVFFLEGMQLIMFTALRATACLWL